MHLSAMSVRCRFAHRGMNRLRKFLRSEVLASFIERFGLTKQEKKKVSGTWLSLKFASFADIRRTSKQRCTCGLRKHANVTKKYPTFHTKSIEYACDTQIHPKTYTEWNMLLKYPKHGEQIQSGFKFDSNAPEFKSFVIRFTLDDTNFYGVVLW